MVSKEKHSSKSKIQKIYGDIGAEEDKYME